jgi:hypothetical protein
MVAGLVGGKAQFAADAFVELFSEGLGHLDREAVQVEIVVVSRRCREMAYSRRLGFALTKNQRRR